MNEKRGEKKRREVRGKWAEGPDRLKKVRKKRGRAKTQSLKDKERCRWKVSVNFYIKETSREGTV